jgi:hypothetical protein
MLVLKLVLTPALIAGASLAGRRWGPAVSGWLVGLPLTSGPVAFFLAVERGTSFAAAATLGALAGAIAEAAFCLAYAYAARRGAWPASLAVASAAFIVVAAILQRASLSLPVAALVAFASLVLVLRLVPRTTVTTPPPAPPRWDLPARMVIATVLVLAITESAPVLGARLSGLLATFPVYAAILTVFAHSSYMGGSGRPPNPPRLRADVKSALRRPASAPAVQVLRGLLWGLFGFVGFFVILGALIERAGITTAFAAASAGALAIQAASLLGARTSADGVE